MTASKKCALTASPGGYTLIEILVAMGLLMALASVMGWFMNTCLRFYRVTENSRIVSDEAANVFNIVGEDIRQMFTYTPYASRRTWAIFLVDRDRTTGRQRIRFTRSMPREEWNPYLHKAGSKIAADNVYDTARFSGNIDGTELRALGGVAEISYFYDPADKAPVLYRGERSPILQNDGRGNSFFNIKELSKNQATPISTNVLHFAVICWHHFTERWTLDWTEKSCVPVWNSTEPYFKMRNGLPEVFVGQEQWQSWVDKFPYGLSALRKPTNPWDDVFPERIRLVVLIRTAPAPGEELTLDAEIGKTQETIPVSGALALEGCQYIVIGSEVMKFSTTERNELFVKRDEGKLGTYAMSHQAGTPVFGAVRFDQIIAVHAGRVSFTKEGKND